MLITVFTPIYNRAYIIDKLYDSLVKQSDKDFEWLVIDDGSTDNIAEKFAEYSKADCGFDIRFIRKENGGKHTCINLGTDLAKGKYFFIVDSDDYLHENAIMILRQWIEGIEKSNDDKLIGVAGAKYNYTTGKIIGKAFSEDNTKVRYYNGAAYLDCTALERETNGLSGDKAEVLRTDIIRRYKFPVFEGEKFLTENCIWYPIAGDGYKLRWFNEPIYFCNYLQDGLTKNFGKVSCIMGEIYTVYIYKKYGKLSFRYFIANCGAIDNAIKMTDDKKKYYKYARKMLGFAGSGFCMSICGLARKLLKRGK